MKILQVITSLHTGGAEKLITELAPALRNRGNRVDVVLFDGTDTPFKRMLQKAGINIIEFSAGGSVYNPLHLIRLIPYLSKYDIVHTHNTAPQLFAAIGSLFCKTCLITTEHSTTNRRRNWWWYRPIDRFMYNRYRKIICISDKAEENLREYIRHCKAEITTIYNGIDVERYAAAEPSVELKADYPDCKAIVMVAGFRYQKDQDTVIRATALLPDRFHTFFIGDGERRAECEQLAAATGVADRVHFLGIRMDVPQLLKASDYVVMSSHWEGLSLSSIEGMSVGKPFIASDVDGLHEMAADAGVLFPHSDCKSLAETIEKLDGDIESYRRVAESCRAKALNFDLSTMVDKYEETYRSICKNESTC